MSKVVSLGIVPKMKVADEIRDEVLKILKDATAEAEAGQVSEILIIMQHPGNNEWSQKASCTNSIVRWIGQLTITIDDWIKVYRDSKDEAE